MNIVADENIPLLKEFFADFGTITTLPGRNMTAEDLQYADVLLVRSVTQVNADLLRLNSSLKFVGTATIGTDHIDLNYLQQADIGFASAPGCNAQAVVNYVLSALCVLTENRQQKLTDLTVAIVGVGNVGFKLRQQLEHLGIKVLAVDPFKTAAQVGTLVSLEEALQADVVCLHTPLTQTGEHPTQHLIGTAELAKMQPNACLLNAGRGPVVDNQALLKHLQNNPKFEAILDVWETEPEPSLALLDACLLATPHIAGYSLDGKMRGTEMIHQRLCDYLGQSAQHSLNDFLPEFGVKSIEFSDQISTQQRFRATVRAYYDVRDDDGRMRHAMHNTNNKAATFDSLRKNYPLRRDIPARLLVKGEG